MSDSNRIDEARGFLLAARKALLILEHALALVESNVGQPPSSRIPALDVAARAALGVDIAADELARATCWLTRDYRQRLEQRESMSRPNPGRKAEARADVGGVGSDAGEGEIAETPGARGMRKTA